MIILVSIPNRDLFKRKVISPGLIGRIAQFSLLAGLTSIIIFTGQAMMKEQEKIINEQPPQPKTKVEQLQESKDILLNPYTVILNNNRSSLTLILQSGMKIDIVGLNQIQADCILFGGGLGCIDDSYLDKITSNSDKPTDEIIDNKKTVFSMPPIDTDDILAGVVIVALLVVGWFIVFKVKPVKD